MARQKLRQHGKRVTGSRVVLHRAGAERIKMRINGEVFLRQAREVTYRVEFRHFRQRYLLLAQQMPGKARQWPLCSRCLGGVETTRAGVFEDDGRHRSPPTTAAGARVTLVAKIESRPSYRARE